MKDLYFIEDFGYIYIDNCSFLQRNKIIEVVHGCNYWNILHWGLVALKAIFSSHTVSCGIPRTLFQIDLTHLNRNCSRNSFYLRSFDCDCRLKIELNYDLQNCRRSWISTNYWTFDDMVLGFYRFKISHQYSLKYAAFIYAVTYAMTVDDLMNRSCS